MHNNVSNQWQELFLEYKKHAGRSMSLAGSESLISVNIGIGDIIQEIKDSVSIEHQTDILRIMIENAFLALGVIDNRVNEFLSYSIAISENDFGEMAENRINMIINNVKSSMKYNNTV